MTRKLLAGLLLTFALAIAFGPSLRLGAANGDTFLVSLKGGTTTTQGTNDSFNASMTPDGRYVAFASVATNLLAAGSLITDTNNQSDIFWRDRQTNVTEMISVNSAGTIAGCSSPPPPANACSLSPADSNNPTISDDGCRVAFLSRAGDLAGTIASGIDPNGNQDVYVRDRCALPPITRLVSKNNATGVACIGFDPSISGNGQFVAYYANESFGGCLIDPTYPAGSGEIFVYDWNLDASKRVSLKNGSTAAATAGGQPSNPTISADGCRIAFVSAQDLVVPTPTQQQVMVRERCSGATPLTNTFVVSRAEGAAGAIPTDNGNTSPMISANGLFVTWVSNSQQLAPNTLTATQTVVYTVNGPPASNTPVFTSPNSFNCTVGVQCFFYANAVSSDIVDSVTCTAGSCGSLFTDQGSVGWRLDSNPPGPNALSVTFHADDGNVAGGQTVDQVATVNNIAPPVNGLPSFINPASATFTQGQSGSFAVNVSRPDVNITCGPNAGSQTTINGGNCLGALPPGLSQSMSGTCNCNGIITGTPSGSGAFTVVYKVFSPVANVWVRDIAGGHTFQANVTSGGVQSSQPGFNPSISATGRYVIFQSSSADLGGSSTRQDVFLRDLTLNTTEIASLGTANVVPNTISIPNSSIYDNHTLANNWTSRAGISTDGRFVLFTSNATNLAPVGLASDANAREDIFIHQRLADPPGTLIVHKDFSDFNTSNVSISVTCGGGATPAASPLNARDNPDTPATFTINGANGGTCTATETVPTGYTPNQAGCANVVVSSGATAQCTIINTLNTATLRVHKDFSDGNTSNVAMSVTCTGGAAAAVSPLNARDNPDTPAVFTINLVPIGGTDCTATEATPSGYTPDQSNCAIVNLMPGANVNCTITNAPLAASSATLTVRKDFTDTNASNVSMAVTCTGGAAPAFSPLSAHDNPDTPAVFTINNVPLAGASCTATEATPAGYTQSTTTCTNVALSQAGSASCTITNTPSGGGGGAAADLVVAKSHPGNFVQGQAGATYTITVTNAGAGPTSGVVTVTDLLPAGLTATAIAGPGWTCTQPSGPCSRSDVLAAGASFPSINLMVNVALNAPPSLSNMVSVSGGGQTNVLNDTATDPATVIPALQAQARPPSLGATFGAIFQGGGANDQTASAPSSEPAAAPAAPRPAAASASLIQPPNTGDAGLLPE